METPRRLAWWMDECFQVPGTRIRFGLDAVIGLFPGLGEMVTSVIQTYLVLNLLAQKEVPVAIAIRMVVNVAIDSAVGAIPFVGDLFDVFFKANTRNVRLVESVQTELGAKGRVSSTRHWIFLGSVALVLLAVIGLAAYAAIFILKTLWSLVQTI